MHILRVVPKYQEHFQKYLITITGTKKLKIGALQNQHFLNISLLQLNMYCIH